MPGLFKAMPQDVEHLMVSLRSMRDELLAHVSAKGIADAVDDIARRIENAKDTTELKSHLAWMEARDRFATMEPMLAKALDAVRRTGDSVADALPIEAARLQASLALMDAKDAVEERSKRASADLQKVEQSAHEALVDLKVRLAPLARAVGSIV